MKNYNFDYNKTHELGMLCAYLSMLAYDSATTKKNIWLSRFFSEYELYEDSVGNLQYDLIFDEANKYVFVSIRGTETDSFIEASRDLWVSLQFWSKKLEGNKYIHTGYYKAGERLKEKIFPILRKYDDYNVVFTGHSLGGVLSKYLGFVYESKSKVYTFGSPRLGSKGIFKNTPCSLHCYINIMDLIPLYHPRYHDCKDVNYVLTSKGFQHSSMTSESSFVPVMSLITSTLRKSNSGNLSDAHSIKNYVKSMSRVLRRGRTDE